MVTGENWTRTPEPGNKQFALSHKALVRSHPGSVSKFQLRSTISTACFLLLFVAKCIPAHICRRSGPRAGGADGGGIPAAGHTARNGAAVPIPVLQAGTPSITQLPQFKEDGPESILSKRESPQKGPFYFFLIYYYFLYIYIYI